MIELGKRDTIFGAERLIALQINGKPETYPTVPSGSKVICGYDQGLGERIFVCETLEDMQELYDGYAMGGALRIHWYHGDDLGFVFVAS